MRSEACRILGRYNNDLAFETLEKLLLTTAEDVRAGEITYEDDVTAAEGVRRGAVHGISTSPHPKALPRLWSFAGDPEYGVRLTVLHKAAKVKTREAVAVIDRLTTDDNEVVRNEALRYQRELAKGRDRPDR
jgi:HEAT repeat protein